MANKPPQGKLYITVGVVTTILSIFTLLKTHLILSRRFPLGSGLAPGFFVTFCTRPTYYLTTLGKIRGGNEVYKTYVINLLGIFAALALSFLILARAATPTAETAAAKAGAYEATPGIPRQFNDRVIIKSFPADAVIIEALPAE
jgi:hypothetical protein